MSSRTEINGKVLTDEEILTLPEANVPAGDLPRFRELRTTILEKQNSGEITIGGQTPPGRYADADERKKAEDERHKRAVKEFERLMLDTRLRAERLLEQIAVEKELNRKRNEEIDQRAIRLRDGRLVYVGERGEYVDQNGRRLGEKDASEAADKRKKNSATWKEHEETRARAEALDRMEENVRKIQSEATNAKTTGLTDEQLRKQAQIENSRMNEAESGFGKLTAEKTRDLESRKDLTDLESDDYMSLYGSEGRTTSFAKSVDETGSSNKLQSTFASAAEGQGSSAPESDEVLLSRTAKPTDAVTPR